MNIRKAEVKDAKELNWLLTLLIRDEKQYDDNIDPNFVVTNMYENYILDKTKFIILAEMDNKIVGYLYGYIKETDPTIKDKTGVLDALFVLEEYRKNNIANNLINEFKKWAIEENIKTVEVNVCSENIKAKNLYIKNNFKTKRETMILNLK